MDRISKIFSELKLHGIYFKVIEEGEIQSGDKIELIKESEYTITISDVVECRATKGENQVKLKEILNIQILPEELKNEFMDYLK